MKGSRVPDPERLFSIFRELVGIDSESGSERAISHFIRDFLNGLNIECIEDGAGDETGGEAGNTIARIPGGEGFVILSAHMDTVKPGSGVVLHEDDESFRSSTDTILGADDKVGVAVILYVAEHLAKTGMKHRGIEMVFSVQEEQGLAGAKRLDLASLEGKWGVVLDGCGEVGGIVTEAPGRNRVAFRIAGRSAHAGVEPEKGVSAIVCAAKAISQIDTGRLDPETTSNIGRIEGGVALNIVPDYAFVECELRSLSEEKLERETARLIEHFRDVAERNGCDVEVETERSFDGFRVDAGSTVAGSISRAMSAAGIDPFFVKSGGASDANVFNTAGIEMVNINVGFENVHTVREYIGKADMLSIAGSLLHLVSQEGAEDTGRPS